MSEEQVQYPKDSNKEKLVHGLFSRIAPKYDFLNDLMTGSLHRLWKNRLINITAKAITVDNGAKVLDLCTGTGDIAEKWIRDKRVREIVGLDSCAAMLKSGYARLEAKYKGAPPKLQMVEGDALEIPYPDNYFDAVTIGFGLRNVSNLGRAIQEIHRVMKPGAMVASLDLGHPNIPFIDFIYKNIFLKLVPILGAIFAGDQAAYQYLVDSLETWPSQRELSQGFYDLGFIRSFYKDILLGTVAIVVAQK